MKSDDIQIRIACEMLAKEWEGKTITKENIKELEDSFHHAMLMMVTDLVQHFLKRFATRAELDSATESSEQTTGTS